jgi:cytochrome P450
MWMTAVRPTLPPDETGRIYDPFIAPQKDNPHVVWKRSRQAMPVFWSDVVGTWVVSNYKDVAEVLGDPTTFINAGGTRSLQAVPAEVEKILAEGYPENELRSPLVIDPPDHARIKKFLVAVFTMRRINALEGRAYNLARELVDAMIGTGRADFVSQFAYRFPLTLVLEMIGIPAEHGEQLHEWSSQKMSLQWGRLTLEAHLAAARGFVDFQNYLKRLIEQRRTKPADDIISAFIELRVDGERPLSDAEVVGQMMGVIAAGHETTMNMLSLTLWHALEHRAVWEAICADPSAIPGLIEEGLRYDSPSQSLWRTTTREVTLSGVKIPAGERVSVLIASANRDAAVYRLADQFDPLRKLEAPHMSFGRGLHFCVGAALSRLEGRVTFEVLSQRIPSLRLATSTPPTFTPNATQRFLEALPVEWDVESARRRA